LSFVKQFHLDNFKGSQIRSKAQFLDNSEKPNKYFFRKETKQGKKKNISEIKTGDGTIWTSMSKNFCCELSYTSNKDTDDSTFSIRHVFSAYIVINLFISK
jgi:hypothetical protein